eukprot:5425957-Pleurochrysis_carterae.AAC.1
MSSPVAAHRIETPSHYPREGAKGQEDIGIDGTGRFRTPRRGYLGVRITRRSRSEGRHGHCTK